MDIQPASRRVVLARKVAQKVGGVLGGTFGFRDAALNAAEDDVHLSGPLRQAVKPVSCALGMALGALRFGVVGALGGALAGPLAVAALLAIPSGSLAKATAAGLKEGRDQVVYRSDQAMGLLGGVPILTSQNDPLHVDYLNTGLPGKLGMTIAPGQHSNRVDCQYERELDSDLNRLKTNEHVDAMVTLMEPQEFPRWGIPDLRGKIAEHGMESIWYPIADTSTPASMDATKTLVHDILDRCGKGQNLVIHCRAGLGRTGTIAACCLVAQGATAAQAVARVRQTRPGTIDQGAQEKFVARFEQELRPAKS